MAPCLLRQTNVWKRFSNGWTLEEETFSDRCYDHEANKWLAHVEILTSCGMVLDECSYLDECPVCNGATLTVILKTVDDLAGLETESETAADA